MLVILWIIIFGFILLMLLSGTIIDLWQFYRTNNKYYLTRIAVFWTAPFVFIGTTVFLIWYLSPVDITKDHIVGCYEVDDHFYNGPNAQWQKKHFRFEVLQDNSFTLYERLADQTDKPFTGTVRWANLRPEKWSVHMITAHHIVDRYPTLYRQQHGFYYVFRTKKFGNMFFRRSGDRCLVKLAAESSES